MKLIDGKKAAAEISAQIKNKINEKQYKPRLVIIQVGDNEASNKYIDFKLKKAKELGVEAVNKKYESHFPQRKIIEDIQDLAPWVDGIIVQLPLPDGYETQKILDAVPHDKDVDGLSTGNKSIVPATPRGILDLIRYANCKIKDKIVAVVGQSKLVGKPTADLMEQEGAKEVIRIDKNTGLSGTERADILIVAAGQKNLIKAKNIKDGSVIIDVGINTLGNGKITGDVDRKSVGNKPFLISPVPGGVGPMTVISLFSNLIESIK